MKRLWKIIIISVLLTALIISVAGCDQMTMQEVIDHVEKELADRYTHVYIKEGRRIVITYNVIGANRLKADEIHDNVLVQKGEWLIKAETTIEVEQLISNKWVVTTGIASKSHDYYKFNDKTLILTTIISFYDSAVNIIKSQ